MRHLLGSSRRTVAGIAAATLLCAVAGAPPARSQDAPAAPGPPAPAAAPALPGVEAITAADLEHDVRALSDDAMKGRDVQSGGIEKAAEWVRTAMTKIGLEPAGDGRDYYASFRVGMAVRDPAAHVIERRQKTLPASAGWLTIGPADGHWGGHLVSGGDGSDRAWARLENPDGLRGAWIFVTSARALYEPDTIAWLQALAERAHGYGAVGVIHVPTKDMPPGRWGLVQRMLLRPRPAAPEDVARPPATLAVWMERAAMDALFGAEQAGRMLTAPPFAGARQPAPGDDALGLDAATTLQGTVAYKNVCGRLPGTDPTLGAETVMFSAHYDHIGTRRVRPGADGICNGADDDASGVSACLALARAFKDAPPKRSILVVAFTAEEQGLIGSKHWADHPTVPLAGIVADFNIEMIGRPAAGGPGHCWITGYPRSSFGALVAEAARPYGVRAEPDPYADMGFFGRSDNFSLAKHGVPAHSLSTYDPVAHHDYHQPGDEADKCDFANMQTLVRGFYAAARRMADGTATPAWTAGDPLAAARGR